MRILTVTHFFESHGGGIERVAGNLNRQFAKLGIEAVWAASSADSLPNGEVEAVPLRCINPTERLTGLPMPIPGLAGVRRLNREIRRSDAIIVHDSLYVTSILALIVAKLARKPVILVQHIAGIPFASPILKTVMRIANRVVTRPMLWGADARVFISDTVRREILGSPSRLHSTLAFNGVDKSLFHYDEVDHRSVGIGKAVLFVGRYVEKKGLSVVRALAAMRPDLSFEMVGSGPIRPSNWGLPNVRDLGPLDQHVIAELYRSADLLLLPSVGEGYPLVIQEAMACGLAVICGEPSNRADPRAGKWLKGVSIDLSDAEGSAARCSEAIDSLDFTSADRAAMAGYAARAYDWDAMASTLIDLATRNQTVGS